MAVKQTKKFSDVSAVSTVSTSQYLPLTDGSGNVTRISLANLKAALLAGMDLNAIEDGIFIAYHNSDGTPLMVKPHKWTSIQSGGEQADGVIVSEGGKLLMIAPTEANLYWSSAAVSAGGTTTTSRRTAIADQNGETSTAAQITHAECQGNSYAPGFCHNYARLNPTHGKGQAAGSWWLPSLGEMETIYANMKKINYALSLINGATQLTENWYWTSTEYSAILAWLLTLTNGGANGGAKATSQGRVRPVSAFF